MGAIDPRTALELAALTVAAFGVWRLWQTWRAERLRADRALALLEMAPANLIVLDRHLRVSHASAHGRRALRRQLGDRAPELVGQELAGVLPRQASGGGHFSVELPLGSEGVELAVVLPKDASGSVSGGVGVWRVCADKARQRRAGILQTLQHLPVNSLLIGTDGCIEYVTDAGSASLAELRSVEGSQPGDWLGRTPTEVFGRPVPLEHTSCRIDLDLGLEFIELSTVPLEDAARSPEGWIVTWRRTTRERRSVDALERTVLELGSATDQLSVAATQLIANADQTADRAGRMLERTRQVTENTHSVANATEQMSGTLNELSSNTRELADGVNRAVVAVDRSKEIVDSLRGAGREITRVTETISDIADQTNLLALNATIEAAAAGDAGRGFAVVANEVKELARETMGATDSIDTQVQSIIKRSEDVASAVDEIAEVVRAVNSLAGTLASAVEQQSATTNEIAGAVSFAADSARVIGGEMEHLAHAATSSTQAAESIRAAAEQLNVMTRHLDESAF